MPHSTPSQLDRIERAVTRVAGETKAQRYEIAALLQLNLAQGLRFMSTLDEVLAQQAETKATLENVQTAVAAERTEVTNAIADNTAKIGEQATRIAELTAQLEAGSGVTPEVLQAFLASSQEINRLAQGIAPQIQEIFAPAPAAEG